MPVHKRALLLGMAGPAIQTLGLVWMSLHLATSHHHGAFSARHLLFEPWLLMIVVGFMVSVVLVPLALEVVRATEDEMEIPVFGADEEGLALEPGLTLSSGQQGHADH